MLKVNPWSRCAAWFYLGFLAASAALCGPSEAATRINPIEAELRAALETADHVVFASSGILHLSNTIAIASAKRIEADGSDVTLSGSNQTRIFDVLPGASLHLNNLTLLAGLATGTNGALHQTGGTAEGGAIRVMDGSLIVWNCRFMTNNAIGGTGGDSLSGDTESPGTGGEAKGGAIFVSSGSLVLSNCVFEDNITRGGNSGRFFGGSSRPIGGESRGGSVYVRNSGLDLQRTVFSGSQAIGGNGSWSSVALFPDAYGGAVYLESGTAKFETCTASQNYADTAGGALYNQNASLVINQSIFATNQSTKGGAIFIAGNRAELTRCSLNYNSVFGRAGFHYQGRTFQGEHAHGGALFVGDASCAVSNSTFAYNGASGGNGYASSIGSARAGSAWGGAIFDAGQLVLQNVTIALNVALSGNARWRDLSAGYGGGLCSVGGWWPSLIHCTIASNRVDDTYSYSLGAGCFTSNSVSVLATIFEGNFANFANSANVAGSLSDRGFNLSSDSTMPIGSSSSRLNIDPILAPLADNGGFTPTMALQSSSPAIDAAGPFSGHPQSDQRGVRRPARGRSDIGAFEQTFLSIAKSPTAGFAVLEYQAVPGEHYILETSISFQGWIKADSQQADQRGGLFFQSALEGPFRFFRVVSE